ncbi:APC family permease [Peribacillus sp. NPDC094092]|uniref:APC family permease n=1 Tax=Peribacillus sp. NPDC094092 TaxID=3390611 RepID=UPI003CFBEF05
MNKHGDLKRSLNLWHIVIIGLGYMAPTVVFDTFGIVSEETNGHVPAAYLFAMLAILFTASSYRKMVVAFPTAGSAYTYTGKSLHPSTGFLVGWMVLLDYIFTPMINALISSIYAATIFPNFPTWLWIISFVAIITLTNIFSLKVSISINTLFVLFQSLVACVFVILSIKELLQVEGTSHLFPLHPFYSANMEMSSLLNGAAILCFSFLGFDSVTTLAEETNDPKKTISRAIFLIVMIGGILFITASYFAQSSLPLFPNIRNVDGTSSEMAFHMGGILFQSILFAASLTSTIASGIVSQISASRLLYAMGKDNIIPRKIFSYVHPRFGTPIINIILIGIVALTAIFLNLATATSFITFGALTAFTFVNISVFSHYFIRKKMRNLKSTIIYLVSPFIGTTLLGFLWINLKLNAIMLGLAWGLLGAIYLFVSKKSKKEIPKFDLDGITEEQIK